MKLCHIATERSGGYAKMAMSGRQKSAVEVRGMVAHIVQAPGFARIIA
jgi:hypothetical protein